ncbi:MAG: hypothetical protein B9S32_00875 [Verrucomicrobia bacterium Tous-C9LFEB]|nr:MAG: hypothetical protein B9S32_00875 [Verrucomicrobia bacterium Tous-C9LFEB]
MKTTATAIAGVLIFLGFAILPLLAAETQELLKNADFEEDRNGDGRADHWFSYPNSLSTSSDPVIRTVRETNDAASGKSYIQISRSSGKGTLNFSQHIPLQTPELQAIRSNPGGTLALKGKIRNGPDGGNAAIFAILIFQSTNDPSRKLTEKVTTPIVSAINQWEEVCITFKVADIIPPNSELIAIDVNLQLISSKGSADFDDFSLKFE